MHCNYCTHEATSRIPSNPGEVCPTHAIEFWTGLLAYAKKHPPVDAQHVSPSIVASPSAFGMPTRHRRSRNLAVAGGRTHVAGAQPRSPLVRISKRPDLIAG
jgi:hypothetical protein